MTSRTILVWHAVHRWTSLVCTAFLLLLCLTGLPLIFVEEINSFSETEYTTPLSAQPVGLDRLADQARALYPGEVVSLIGLDDDSSQAFVWMAPSFEAVKEDRGALHFVRFDRNDGALLERSTQMKENPATFMGVMFRLHRDLFADLAGELFLAAMAMLFVVAIVSGLVLYGPYTRKLAFGTVRDRRGPRTRWLDLHNLLGITTLAWALVVGATGVMNELSTPLFALWRQTQIEPVLAASQAQPPLAELDLASPQAVLDTVSRAFPETIVTSIRYPTPLDNGSPHHFVIWTKGGSALTARLTTPILVDGRSGAITAVVAMPWYLRALQVSRPLHFGDYGGLPLKILWALLDVVTILVLGSGLYLWLVRHRRPPEAARRAAAVAQLRVEAAE